jgi:hypothetical protein
MLLDGSNWQLVFLGSERFANWRSYVLPYCAEPCPRALMEFDGEGCKQGQDKGWPSSSISTVPFSTSVSLSPNRIF